MVSFIKTSARFIVLILIVLLILVKLFTAIWTVRDSQETYFVLKNHPSFTNYIVHPCYPPDEKMILSEVKQQTLEKIYAHITGWLWIVFPVLWVILSFLYNIYKESNKSLWLTLKNIYESIVEFFYHVFLIASIVFWIYLGFKTTVQHMNYVEFASITVILLFIILFVFSLIRDLTLSEEPGYLVMIFAILSSVTVYLLDKYEIIIFYNNFLKITSII